MAISPLISRHLLPLTLKLLYASLRISVTPQSWKRQLSDKGAIFTFWHGKMVTGWLLARALFPEKNIIAVVSLSEDGRTLSDTLEQLDYTLIRGSSSRGGDEVKHASVILSASALQVKAAVLLRLRLGQFLRGTRPSRPKSDGGLGNGAAAALNLASDIFW